MCKGKKKCCLITSSIFLFLGVTIFLFGAVILEILIKGSAQNGALLTKDNEDLWASIPGKSGVHIFQNFFFYDITNLEKVVFSDDKAIANEKGPFSAEEITDFLNIKYSNDNDTAGFNIFRHFINSDEEIKRQQDTVMNMLSVVSLGAWYQAKTISRSQVALKALYTIYKGLTNDLYYTAAVRAIQQALNDTLLEQLKYIPKEKVYSFFSDSDFGLYRTNFQSMKAILNHPCEESKNIMDYFGLAFHEIQLLKDKLSTTANNLIFNNRNKTTLGFSQWLNLSINQNNSIYEEFGPEYGYYLKANNLPASNFTLENVTQLFALNDFNSTLPLVDDTYSLLNKYNLDKIFTFENYEDSIKYINNNMQISNYDEASNLRKYLDYISGDMAYRFSKGGTKGIGALSDFLSQGFTQLFTTMGEDLYYGILETRLFNEMLNKTKCEDFVKQYIINDEILKDLIINFASQINSTICENRNLTTENSSNTRFWIDNILNKSFDLKNILNFTDLEYTLLKRDNSKIVKSFAIYATEILKDNNVRGNYKFFNKIKIAANQWTNGIVTRNFNNTQSIRDWRPDHYKSKVEFSSFCVKYYPEKCSEITSDEIASIANSENLFNSQFISSLFIEYYQNRNSTQNKFAQKYFIDYMRYFMVNEVLNLFTQKSAKDLLWGYKDELLETLKNTNYFIGGDPTLDSTFSFLNNMTNLPDKEDVWSFYTGKKDPKSTRSYFRVMGYDKSDIIEKYFDGKTIRNDSFRNPWKNTSMVRGTDALSFAPGTDENTRPWVYLDQLCRSGEFVYRNRLKHLKLDLNRFIADISLIQNSTLFPSNDNFYSYKYNGFGNVTSVFKAPLYASKPYYYQCDNSAIEQPILTRAIYNHNETKDQDDIDLFEESFIDAEPYTGAIIRAGQKILISALLQKDELFEINNDKFVPIYYVFRTGNFTQESVDIIFAELFTAFLFQKIIIVVSSFIILFTIALIIYLVIKIRKDKKVQGLNEHLLE